MAKGKNVKQLTIKEGLSLQQELYQFKQLKSYWKTVSENKEKTIQGLIDRMVELENDLKYEVKLNSILQEKIEKRLDFN